MICREGHDLDYVFGMAKNSRLIKAIDSEPAKAQCHTMRLQVFKIGVHIHVTVRKVCFLFWRGDAVPGGDNLKSGVHKPQHYDPDVNPTYSDFANHMGFAVVPARPRKPRDKLGREPYRRFA